MKHKLNTFILIAVAVALVLIVVFPLFRAKPVKVGVARAETGPLRVTVDGEGKTRVRDRFMVTAPVGGLLRRIELRRGDAVAAGGKLAIIEPAPWSSAPTNNQSSPGFMPSAIVTSPVTGRVLRVLEENERVVSAGTPLLELSNTTRLEVVIDLLSTDAVKVRPGARVLVDDWGGGNPIDARITLVEPSGFTKVSALGIEEQRVNVIAEFVSDAGRLGDGYRVEAHIIIFEVEKALKIPVSSLFRDGEKWNVFVMEGGKARRREVGVGQRTASEAEVTSGLEEGAELIVHPSNQVEDGVRVEPQTN